MRKSLISVCPLYYIQEIFDEGSKPAMANNTDNMQR